MLCVFSFLFLTFVFKIVPSKTVALLFNYSLIILIINYVRNKTSTDLRDKFNFSNKLINKGSSLTIVINNIGEVTFCSENISSILGYSVKEVLGLEFWNRTENPNLTVNKSTNQIDGPLYVRKLKCANGEYKYIQWKDHKHSKNQIISIGNDITNEINIQNQYRNLIENATDIIFEVNNGGGFTYANNFTLKALGYSLDEIYLKNYSEFIRPDQVSDVMNYYQNVSRNEPDFTFESIEIPLLKKNGEEIWVSQKIIIRKNDVGEIIGYSGIARNITALKNIEKEKTERQLKNLKYNNALKGFTAKSYGSNESLESKLKTILETCTKTMDVGRASYWTYFEDRISCMQLYEFKNNTFSTDAVLTKKSFPNYFLAIQDKTQIVAPDVYTNAVTKELAVNYFPINNIVSRIDTPVIINGALIGIVCFEATENPNQWDNEDVNFSRSVSDVIAIAFETKMRLDIQTKLAYKSELLAAMTKCTEQFLNSKDIDANFADVLIIMGRATKSHRSYYYENDSATNLISQKYRWIINNTSLTENNPKLQNLPYTYFEELLTPILNNNIYETTISKIENESLKTKLQHIDVASVILFPIFIKNNFHGFLGFDNTSEEKKWSDDEVNILQTLARNIAYSIERIAVETAIYESEEKFRLLANNIPGVVYLSENDAYYTKLYLNDEIEKLTGYAKVEFLEKRIIYADLIHPDDYDRVLYESKDQLSRFEPFHFTYRIINKKQEVIWVEEFGDAVTNNGKITYVEGIILDITERKMTEEAIKGLEYAEATNKAKSEFFANMSHEIRTPLNGIIGFTDLLMKTKLEEIQQKHMITVNQSAHSLLGIVNDILDFSKIEAGKLDLHIEKHKIRDLLNPIMDLILYESNKKELLLEFIIAPEIPAYFWVDSIRLKQILINLLANAVKFTEKGFVKLEVVLLTTTDSSSRIRFSVLDSGIGILQENQQIIFKAFSQEDNSTTKRFGGTGLGLTISNNLLGLMESQMELNSEVGIGSVFYFDLELQTTNDIEAEPILINNTITDDYFTFQIDPSLQALKIMLVEDNKINMLLLKTIIKNVVPNAIIYEIPNGLIAVGEVENRLPDIIFMDVQMPVMNGYEATKEIRKLKAGESIPIIAITAGTEIEIYAKCMAAGMSDYISKPIIKGVVEAALMKWTSIHNKEKPLLN
jgi:PAS domain S-box-containing protein